MPYKMCKKNTNKQNAINLIIFRQYTAREKKYYNTDGAITTYPKKYKPGKYIMLSTVNVAIERHLPQLFQLIQQVQGVIHFHLQLKTHAHAHTHM